MADLDKIMTALRNAHAAGDTVAAKRLAAMAKAAQGGGSTKSPPSDAMGAGMAELSGMSQNPTVAPKERTTGQAIYDNLIGDPTDGVDSYGERIGRGSNDVAQAGAAGVAGQQDLLGLNGPAKQQAAIDAIRTSPQFTSMQQLGENRILANASATGGLRGGNVQGALAQFSPALLSQLIDQQYSRLGGLTTTGANAAAGVGSATANGQAQIGSAQAGQALANGSALQGVFSSGFGALGQYLGQQQQVPDVVIPRVGTNTPFGQFQLGGGF